MPRDIATIAVAPIAGGNKFMAKLNLVTASYLKLLGWLAGFLVWFAEALESLFGAGVREGIIDSPHRRHDSFEEFDPTNTSSPTADGSATTECDRFTSTSPTSISSDFPGDPVETDSIDAYAGNPTPAFNASPNGSTDIKPFDPYDPQDPFSVFNGDPLNFDPAFHSDPFDTN